MTSPFRAEVYQNEYLPAGSREVHAIMTVTAEGKAQATASDERIIGMLCDVSGSMEGSKLQASKDALSRLIQMLPPECSFFLIAGSDSAQLVCPLRPANAVNKQYALQAIQQMRAFGGTRISNWLRAALDQFNSRPEHLRQVLLLTDGQNDMDDAQALTAVLAKCDGVFQCDCRGVGTDWQVSQLRAIAERLLGTVDLIPSAQQIEADLRGLLQRALAKQVSDLVLRLWTPRTAVIRFVKEVSPSIHDLTGRVRELSPQLREYPTGAWAKAEARDFHFCVEVSPGAVGDEMLAARASLVRKISTVEDKVAEARVLAIWTDDEARSTKINKVVAHYTDQTELAESIQQGLDARTKGDVSRATVLLGRAVKLAHDSGNEATAKLLKRVVEVVDPAAGTVRLRSAVPKEDSMALETRSTKTTRIQKQS